MSNLIPARSNLPNTNAVTSPISLITAPPGDYAIAAGEVFELSVTLRNQGHTGAIINVFIDESSPLRQWCSAPYQRVALDCQQNCEVVFRFSIPVQTLPGFYTYLLVIDAPDHYPEHTPIQHQSQLQVLPPVESGVRGNDPTFFLKPDTISDKPLIVKPGVPHTVSVLVHNRSERVDRFRLACTDLDPRWFKIVYPEGVTDLGLVIDSDSLALNPSAKGEVQLIITLPQTIHAGRYLGTLRLLSVNHPTLILMHGIYIEVQPVCTLGCDLRPLIQRVKRQPAIFHLLVNNLGNTTRELTFDISEAREDPVCTYTITPDRINLRATEAKRITIEAQPTGRWRRPWVGRGRTIPFAIAFNDHHQLPLNVDQLEDELVWEARPWWHLALVILAGIGAVTTLFFIIWWVFFKPPTPPRIRRFDSVAPLYQARNGDIIHLDWEIQHPKQIRRLQLTGQFTDGTTASQVVSYDFSQGIPDSLKDLCVMGRTLVCQNVRTDALQPGDYTFDLTVTPKRSRQSASTATTHTIRLLPIPKPQIDEFVASQPVYQFPSRQTLTASVQKSASQASTPTDIRLNWAISNPSDIHQLILTGRDPNGVVKAQTQRFDFSQGIPDALASHCTTVSTTLLCRNIPTGVSAAGLYTFELSLLPRSTYLPSSPLGSELGAKASGITKTTDTIEVLSTPEPIEQIDFQVNGEDAPAKYQLLANPQDPPILVLSWAVEGGNNPTVELLPSPGTVPVEGAIAYPVRLTTGTETITLKVTPETGDPIVRSMTLETLDPEVVLIEEATNDSSVGNTSSNNSGVSGDGNTGINGISLPGASNPNASPLDTIAPPGGPLPNPLREDTDDSRPAELPPLTR